MNTIEKIIQISEDVEYPDGYNAVTIESNGDSPGIDIFKAVVVRLSADEVPADGNHQINVTAEIWDDDAKELTVREFKEDTQAGDALSVSVGNYIDKSKPIAVHEYAGTVEGVPLFTGPQIPIQRKADGTLKIDGSQIYIDEDWIQQQNLYPDRPNVPGLFWTRVAVRYWGSNTATFGTESIEELDLAGDLREFNLSGEFTTDGEEGKTETLAKSVVRSIFTPAAGADGMGYITCSYKNAVGKAKLKVGNAEDEGLSLTMEADPSSVKVGQPSLVKAEVTFTNAKGDTTPVLEGTVTFSLYKGDGELSRFTAPLEIETDIEEESAPEEAGDPISVSKVPSNIQFIKDPLGNEVQYSKIDGTDIFGPFQPKVNYTIKYDGGGVATTQFVADSIGDGEAIVLGYFKSKQEFVEIAIEEGTYFEEGLSLEADPPTLTYDGEESKLLCVLTDAEGNADNGTTIHLYNTAGHGRVTPGTVITKTIPVEEEEASVEDANTVSVTYPVSEGACHIEFNGQNFRCEPGPGNTLILQEEFPEHIYPVPVTAWYVSGGRAESKYIGPTPLRDEVAIVMGVASGDRKASVNIDSGEGEFAGELDLDADPQEVLAGKTSKLTVTTYIPGPAEDEETGEEIPEEEREHIYVRKTVYLTIKDEDPGVFKVNGTRELVVDTGLDGKTTTPILTAAGATGQVLVSGECQGKNDEETISIIEEEYDEDIVIAQFFVIANPTGGVLQVSDDLWIQHNGAQEWADKYGCVSEEEALFPMVGTLSLWPYSRKIPPHGYIKEVIIDGGAHLFNPDAQFAPGYPVIQNTTNPLRVVVAIAWPNRVHEKSFYVTVVDRISKHGIPGANVNLYAASWATINGISKYYPTGPVVATSYTDTAGKAYFGLESGIQPGMTYFAEIDHLNYVPNVSMTGFRTTDDMHVDNDIVKVPESFGSKPIMLEQLSSNFTLKLKLKRKWVI